MFSKLPTINMDSPVGQTTLEPSSPIGPHQSFQIHRFRPRCPCPHNSLVPPSKPHRLSFGFAGDNLSPGGAFRLAFAGSFSRGEVEREFARVDRYQSSWRKIFSSRACRGTPSKKQPPVPKEQTDAYLKTKTRVNFAVKSVLEVARVGLEVVAETGEVIPVPGLAMVAKLLSNIWDAIDDVGSNRLACLRLTARCAEFLLAIYNEVHEQGDKVKAELDRPLKRLESSFNLIYDLMVELRDRPFWKRFVERDEILYEIERCHELLNDCMVVFNISILMRIEKNTLRPSHQLIKQPRAISGLYQLPRFASSPPTTDDLAMTDAERIRDRLRALQAYQNELDKAADMTDLRQLLSAALNAKSNDDMQRVLQVAGKDMPTAIRTLLMVLEGKGSHWKAPPSSAMRSTQQLPHTRSFTWPLDGKQASVLDGEHIESDIAAVQRLVQGYDMNLPSWTIEKSDIIFQELIGRGFFSNVYKGTWRHRAIAIKVLERSTNRETFLAEVAVWKSLNHPNVLRLYGASDPSQDVPRFLISPYMRNGSLPEYLKRLEWDGSMVSGASMVSEVYGDSSEPDLLRFMVEISRAMEYMHSAHVVHGDLKGANVLLDNDLRCVLADFGRSKNISQISYKNAKHAHGLRWQSPELMAGHSLLTKENDVYAFGITCVEIVTFGSLPWPMMPDDIVKKLVLEENSRPPFPSKIVDRLGIRQVLERCWNDKVMERPTFSVVVKHLEGLMSRLSFYRDRQADLSSPGSGGSGPSPPQKSAPLPKLYSDPPTDMHVSESSVPGRMESFSGLNRSDTVRPRSQPHASSSQNDHQADQNFSAKPRH
ncbi:kinase-like protein [Gymnopus androsaceus JB14]|uniref:Kinase-like protein n=1 Tax=Gymnopus androsaceus JB14 TaxID=1447944 RepID=A0A6A4H6S8_9AGAR|nr:kinase-like protein [Gymnopus androsaceus JB14]